MKVIWKTLPVQLLAASLLVCSSVFAQQEPPETSPDGHWKFTTVKAAVGTGASTLTDVKSGQEVAGFESNAWAFFSKETGVKSDSGWITLEAWKPGVLLFTMATSEHHNVAEKNVHDWHAAYRLKEQSFFVPKEVQKQNKERIMEDLFKTIPSPQGDFTVQVFKESEQSWILSSKNGQRGHLTLGGTGMGVGLPGSTADFSISPDGQWILAILRNGDDTGSARLTKRDAPDGLNFEMVMKPDGAMNFWQDAWTFFSSKTKLDWKAGQLQALGWKPDAVRVGFFQSGGPEGTPWIAEYQLKEAKFTVPADAQEPNKKALAGTGAVTASAPPSGLRKNGFPLMFRPQDLNADAKMPDDLAKKYPHHVLVTITFRPASHPAGKDGVNLQPGEGSWLDRGMKPDEPGRIRFLLPEENQSMIFHTLKVSEGPFTLQVRKSSDGWLETVPLVSPELQ